MDNSALTPVCEAEDKFRVESDDNYHAESGDNYHAESDDKFHDECGVFGIWNVPDAAKVTASRPKRQKK